MIALRPVTAFVVMIVLAACGTVTAPLPAQAAYETKARSAWLYDVSTDTVLFEKNSEEPLPPASMSKLMTLYMLFDALRAGRVTLDETFTVSSNAKAMEGSTMFLDETDTPTVEELIKGVIVQSGNDACVVIAENLAGSEANFARQMNDVAPRIGLTESTFANSSGWPDPNQKMSARDLGRLATHLITEFPEYYGYFGLEEFDFDGRSPSNRFNRNPVLGLGLGADGLKTGHTEEAGYGLVGSAKQNDRRIVFVFTGLDSMAERRQEAEAMINWGFRQFVPRAIAKKGDVIAQVPVWLGDHQQVQAVAGTDIELLVPAIGQEQVTSHVEFRSPVEAPLAEGDAVATLVVASPGMPEKRIPLVSDRAVTRGGFLPRVRASSKILMGKAMDQVKSYME